MITAILPVRGNDKHGSGAWGAPRGARKHRGVDWACPAGAKLLSPVSGVVTKLGLCYDDDHSYRYVELEDEREVRYRFHYVDPVVVAGADVIKGEVLGLVQAIERRYPGITPHVHVEMIRDGNYLNPSLELAR